MEPSGVYARGAEALDGAVSPAVLNRCSGAVRWRCVCVSVVPEVSGWHHLSSAAHNPWRVRGHRNHHLRFGLLRRME